MKLAFVRFLHLFMAVVVLLSSMGFGVVEHSCQLRGKRVYSVHQNRPGCKLCKVQPVDISQNARKADYSPLVSRTDCCEEEARYSKIEVTSSLSHQLIKFIKSSGEAYDVAVMALFIPWFRWAFVQQTNVPEADYTSPPPLSGRHLLAFVHSFLI